MFHVVVAPFRECLAVSLTWCLPRGRQIVDRNNERLDVNQQQFSIIDGDHYGICRFSGADKHAFEEVGKKLKWLAEDSPVARRMYAHVFPAHVDVLRNPN